MNIYDSISKARNATNKAIAEHDIETLMMYCTDDIIIVSGNGTVLHSKTDVEVIWRKIFTEQPNVSFVRDSDEIIISSNNINAWEKGIWKGVNTYSAGGNYAAVWHCDKNIWKIKAEVFVAL